MADPKYVSPAKPHFFQPLLPGFHRYLTIPLAFYKNHIEEKNENQMATLRSDLSNCTWEVKLDGRRITDGWKQFADDHDFRIGDIIVFRHEGDFVFHVTGFGPSLCSLRYSSPPAIDEATTGNVGRAKNMNRKNPNTETESSSDSASFTASVTVSDLDSDKLKLPRRFVWITGMNRRARRGTGKIIVMNEKGRHWTLDVQQMNESDPEHVYINHGWRDVCHANGLKPGSIFTLKMVRKGTLPLFRLSHQHPESSEDDSNSCFEDCSEGGERKKGRGAEGKCLKRENIKIERTRTYRRWKASLSSPRQNRFLTITITPCIHRVGNLRLPREFTRVNRIEKNGTIMIVDKEGREWPTTLWKAKKLRNSFGLGKGFRSFCDAIGAKQGHSFVLELLWRHDSPFLRFSRFITL